MVRMTDLFNWAYMNLLMGTIGICFLLIPALIGFDHVELFSDALVSKAVQSIDFKVSGVALFVSAIPMLLDLIMDLFSGFKTDKSMHCWICRAVIAIATLMVGLQFTLQYDYFHLFKVYATSCFLAMLLFRIVLMTSIMFCLNAINPSLFTVSQTVTYSALTSTAYVCRFYTPADDGSFVTTFIKILIYTWSVFGVYLSVSWTYKLWKCKKSWNGDDYTCIFYLSLLSASIMISCFMLLVHFLGFQFFSYDFLNTSLATMQLIAYSHTFESIILCIIPGRIARLDAILSGQQVLETKKAYVRYISHELRTPLNSVHMGLQLSIGQIPKDATNPLDIMRLETLLEVTWACEVALEILNDLLLYDKLENGLLKLVREKVPILGFISNCLTMFSVQLRAKNIQLTLNNQNYCLKANSVIPISSDDNKSSNKEKSPSTTSKSHIHTKQIHPPVPTLSPFISTCELTEVYSNTAVSSARSVISNVACINNENQSTVNISARSVKSFHTCCSDESKEFAGVSGGKLSTEIGINDQIHYIKSISGRRISVDDCVDIDKSKLGQVIRNIMSNAIKFTPNDGSIQVSVEFVANDTCYLPSNISGTTTNTSQCFSMRQQSAFNTLASRLSYLNPFPRKREESVRVSRNTSSFDYTQVNQEHQLTPIPLRHYPVEAFSPSKDKSTNNFSDLSFERDVESGVDLLIASPGGFKYKDQRYSSISGDGMLIIEIKDNGAGISEANQKRLFKEIVQFNPEVLQGGGGSGLGMWIAKEIMELHGGNISVHSEGECMGSTFRLEIPMTLTCRSHERKEFVDTGVVYKSKDKLRARVFKSSPHTSALSSMKEEAEGELRNVDYNNIGEGNEVEEELEMQQQVLVGVELELDEPLSITDNSNVANTDFTTNADQVTYNDIHQKLSDFSNENDSIASGRCSVFDIETSNSIRNMKSLVPNYQPIQKQAILKIPLNTNQSLLSPSKLSSSLLSVPPEVSGMPSTSLQLLIVDDSAMNRKMLRRLMEVQGHRCDEAADGQIAVNMVTAKSHQSQASRSSSSDNKINCCNFYYDAILMDSVMPNMNGPTATTAIRKLGYKGPIIGVTGNALAEDQQAFIKMGATKVFIKPINVALITSSFKEFGLL